MVDNRVVIKINYDRDKYQKSVIDPRMVTVWHKGRILGVLIVLLCLIGVSLYGLLGNGSETPGLWSGQASHQGGVDSTAMDGAPQRQNELSQAQDGNQKSSVLQTFVIAKPVGIIFDKRVIRASINRANDDSVKQASVIVDQKVIVNSGKHQVLDYFSEVKRGGELPLFHRWLKNDQVIHAKQFVVKENKSRLMSSKKFGIKDIGLWQVVLVDGRGRILSRSSFEISAAQ